MLKKILFMTMVCIVGSPEKIHTRSDDQNIAAAIVVGVGAIGTAVYWMKRESNDALIVRAKSCMQKNEQFLGEIDADTSQANMLASQKRLHQEIQDLKAIYQAISNRYDSYLKPWNWSSKMIVIRDELATAIQKNDEMLRKVAYLIALKEYQEISIDMHNLTMNYKEAFEQGISLCMSLDTLQQISVQKKTMQNNLKLFFAKAELLSSRLTDIIWILSVQDRNMSVENSFNEIKEQATFLKIALKYVKCILNINQEVLLIKEARKAVGASSYPLKDFVDTLQHDVRVLKNMHIFDASSVQAVIDLLQELYSACIASNEYVLELRAYDIYLEQQRQAQAAARQAEAAARQAEAAVRAALATQDAADAASRQARASEERNRVERERNKIEQERNNIERNKQNNNNNNNNRW